MKIRKKIVKKVFMISILMVILFNLNVYARDPNSSKGYAEYDEQAAQEETQQIIENQNQEQSNVNEEKIKSTNNYLKSLNIEGYEITPQFNKEINDYAIEQDIQIDKLNIIAEPEDTTATINGNGEIALKDGKNEYRIEVTSEAGAVRTYTIEINKVSTNIKDENVVETESDNKNILDELKDIKLKNNILLIIILILVVILIITIVIKNKNKKSK